MAKVTVAIKDNYQVVQKEGRFMANYKGFTGIQTGFVINQEYLDDDAFSKIVFSFVNTKGDTVTVELNAKANEEIKINVNGDGAQIIANSDFYFDITASRNKVSKGKAKKFNFAGSSNHLRILNKPDGPNLFKCGFVEQAA